MEAYIGQIDIFPFNWAPQGYALCSGQLLQITQNQALFALLGTSYGGDGRTTFGLPNLNGRAPVGFGAGPGLSPYMMGQLAGTESVALTLSNIPSHNHTVTSTTATASNSTGDQYSPGGNVWAGSGADTIYGPSTGTLVPLSNLAVTSAVTAVGGQPHSNQQPYLVGNYCIAITGLFPSRN